MLVQWKEECIKLEIDEGKISNAELINGEMVSWLKIVGAFRKKRVMLKL
jgi:hypothetical protein